MATKATGYLELDIKGFDSAIKTAKNLMVGFAAAFGAFKLGSFLADGVKDAINFGKEMQSAGRAMGGFDPGKLLLAQKALEKVGMGAEEARGHIGDFIKEGRNISEIFGGADNYAKALQSAARDYGAQADVLTRSGKFLQTVFNTLEAISSKVRTFFLTMTEQFVGPLQVALDLLNTVDLAGVGADFGKAIGDAATVIFGIFKNGDVIEVLKLGIQYAFFGGIDVLMTGFQKAVAFFSSAMSSISGSFRESFFADDMITLMKNVFKGLGEIISAAILKAISESASAIGMSGAAKELDVAAKREFNASKNHFNSVANIVEDTDFLKAGFDSSKAIKAGLTASEGIKFGESESGKKANELFNELKPLIEAAKKTGDELVKNAQTNNNNAAPAGVLTNFSGSSSRVIADSLAKIGAGGNFLRVGMSLQEKTNIDNLLANKQTAEATTALYALEKDKKPSPVLIGQ